ncbi:MAG TPA: hypothetical protein VFA36_08340, partial [Burkholderiales bacterium]|nr:hypothetical protein [Burkholderiales bacterium]
MPRFAAVALVLGAAGLAHAAKLDPQDAALLAARDAFESNNRAKLAHVAPQLEGHVLAPYVEYWQLFQRLPAARAEDVRQYFSRYPGSVLSEQLRIDWLKVLGRSGRWELFNEEYPALSSDDPEVTCYALLGRWKRDDAVVPDQFKTFWNAPRELPDGCMQLARALAKAGLIDSSQAWARFRTLVDTGLMGAARRSMEFVPRAEAIDPRKLSAVIRSPARFLRSPQADYAKVADRELVIAAMMLASDTDPLAVAKLWSGGLSEKFSAEDVRYVWLMLAMNGAQRHLPEALGWFAKAGSLNDEQLAWRARIAMRTENWAELRNSIDRMSPVARNDAIWTYWYGRAERELGSPLEADGYFGRIAGEHSFYGRLASDELGVRLRIPPRAPLPTEAEI